LQLTQPFVTQKEERLVLLDWPAESAAELAKPKCWNLGGVDELAGVKH